MKTKEKLDRREFLISTGWKGLISGFGVMGLSMVNPPPGKNCPDTISCCDCYKMGVCQEKAALKIRKEIKTGSLSAKVSKGAKHG